MPAEPATFTRMTQGGQAGLFARLRADFLTGLVVVLPAALTIALVLWAIGRIDASVMPLLPGHLPYEHVAGMGVLAFVVGTTAAGAFARGLLGRGLVGWSERQVARLPVARSIHATAKQFLQTVLERDDTSFRQVCMIEYPEPGLWAIGFVVRPAAARMRDPSGVPDLVAVFVPTAPNPTTGFLAYAPLGDLRLLDMPADAALRLVMSGGLVDPGAAGPAPRSG
ncbi:MAG: DUF502 domain-containing protein [Rhodobacteraceae bacterium]|nr:DUF502 domain-containing protein [Paracoccaceae bacterium]